LLFIGSTPNKNLPRVIEALKGIQCHLDIVGNIPDEQLVQLKEAAVSYSQSERLSEEALNQKFALADILLFPTLFEGFGLPILEAQQAGRPVLTSDLAPMNWVAGSGACLVDPTNVESIREGILKLLSEEAYRKELIMNGLINLERFSPKIISEQYLNIYESMN
jgi:glycosyltransferase involved in cell wall biosynthesis